jgi:ABC-type polar amino acid transport system ATPase subunit
MPPFIKVEGLHKAYGDHVVIDSLDLAVDQGEIVVLQGPSGIGKSTLLRCLTYLEPFQRGMVRVGNAAVKPGLDEKRDHDTIVQVRGQLGFVFQFFNLFPHLTVLENITVGPVRVLGEPFEQARRTALSLLDRVHLSHKASAYPNALSGGQQQRVGIARALAMHPKGVLFDEPTSSLDPAMKDEIIEVIEDFAKDGLTMILVTHEPQIIQRIVHRVITLGPGCRIMTR